MSKVLVVAPDKAPEVVDLPDGLDPMQKLVGGWIENVTLEGDPDLGGIGLICNEEGKLMGLPWNRFLPEIEDTICGTFFISRFNEDGETVDLTVNDIMKYSLRFAVARP